MESIPDTKLSLVFVSPATRRLKNPCFFSVSEFSSDSFSLDSVSEFCSDVSSVGSVSELSSDVSSIGSASELSSDVSSIGSASELSFASSSIDSASSVTSSVTASGVCSSFSFDLLKPHFILFPPLIKFFFYQIDGYQRGDSLFLHGNTIESVCCCHRSPSMCNNDKLRVFRQFM